MYRRQDPRKLYAAYGTITPTFDALTPQDRHRWTMVALAAAGLDLTREDPAFAALAREFSQQSEARELHWQLRLWARMSAAVPTKSPGPGLHYTAPQFADPAALPRVLGLIAHERVEVLLGPLLHPGESEVAEGFMRTMGVLSMANGFGPRPPAQVLLAAEAFARLADRFELLEDGDAPRPEARLFRNGARLLRDLAALGAA